MSPLTADLYNVPIISISKYPDQCSGSVVVRNEEKFEKSCLSTQEAVPVKESILEKQFHEQADKWQRETGHLSSPTKQIMHPSYQAILGMGKDVIPLLLRDMQKNRRSWFWALSYLTQQNPISPKDSGNMDNMIKAWTEWGKEKGYL